MGGHVVVLACVWDIFVVVDFGSFFKSFSCFRS